MIPLSTVGPTRLGPILDQPTDALRSWFESRRQPNMRVGQVRRWILAGRAESFERMSDIPNQLRDELAQSFITFGTQIDEHHQSEDGTHKLLLKLPDQAAIECVLIQEEPRRTACISTQVGCGMGCVFCASGLNGVVRNLTSGEILEQLVRLRNLCPVDGRLSHVVVMGMGEPLANLDNLLNALEIAGRPEGLGIGARHITISTVGLPAKIRALADHGKQYHLAVSLHAPNDELRTQIVPTNAKTGIAEILSAADYFFEKTGRQVTYEYVLLGGLNDSDHEARQLVDLLRGRQAHMNLIPFNEVDGLPYLRPDSNDQRRFVEILRGSGLSVKIRKRKGAEIDAACGQLRRRAEAAAKASDQLNLPQNVA
jgi:23S rRNA (adenine2503-C2)-methyltransferase